MLAIERRGARASTWVLRVGAAAVIGCAGPRGFDDAGTSDDVVDADTVIPTDADTTRPICTTLVPGPPVTSTVVDGPPPPLPGGAITPGVYDLTAGAWYTGAGDGGTAPDPGAPEGGALALGADGSLALVFGSTDVPTSATFAGTYAPTDAGLALTFTCPASASWVFPYEATPTTFTFEFSIGGANIRGLSFTLRR